MLVVGRERARHSGRTDVLRHNDGDLLVGLYSDTIFARDRRLIVPSARRSRGALSGSRRCTPTDDTGS